MSFPDLLPEELDGYLEPEQEGASRTEDGSPNAESINNDSEGVMRRWYQ